MKYVGGAALPLRRWLTLAAVTAGLALAAVVGSATGAKLDQANAYSAAGFCDIPGGTVSIPAGGRCVDYRRVRHRFLRATVIFGDHAGNFCVGAKQNSDGTGANTKSFGCHIPTYDGQKVAMTPTDASPGSPLGYATIINGMGWVDLFYGYMQWYP